ncbi:1-pyrroline-5-carboxylate dehydrogenase [Clydaea vesicula]|uniref:Multifunctional fusion protein n=1 Tax=Clydaea vesicula TaxID=447962 RepID=A0AAD5XZP3_9FUNG|nr:1-pyrroline-5-carboxylate dehydrogenase [Clydaea vesicula]
MFQLRLINNVRSFSSTSNKKSVLQVPQMGIFKLPEVRNEPKNKFMKGSPEKAEVKQELNNINSQLNSSGPYKVPMIINGNKIFTQSNKQQHVPFDHKKILCSYSETDKEHIDLAIKTALEAKLSWENMPFNDRAAIFLKAADLLSTKYRSKVIAATMMGQGKTACEAEIDAAAELADFWRFNVKYAAEIYSQQPSENSPHVWNRLEYRPLEGFVVAFSPFNFTAIGGNLCTAPALMGNVVLWKPSPMSMYSNYLLMQILKEAGLPDGVIQFIPGDAPFVVENTFNHPEFAGLHFTGSTAVFKHLWKKIGDNLEIYKSYPRIVGETGGKNLHFLHKSADVNTAVYNTIRGGFEFQGQKCSATSRVYIPESLWPQYSELLKNEVLKIKQGSVEDFSNFMSSVINRQSFDKIKSYIDEVKEVKDGKQYILVGGETNDKVGYEIQPTVIVTKDPFSKTMTDELFGPVVTCYVYPDEKYIETLEMADKTTDYALTGSVFAVDREAIITASNVLRNSAGNFYINDKSTGAVVGQQPFGGGRSSGTNDKAGSILNLFRWISPRTIKENFVPLTRWNYESNMES